MASTGENSLHGNREQAKEREDIEDRPLRSMARPQDLPDRSSLDHKLQPRLLIGEPIGPSLLRQPGQTGSLEREHWPGSSNRSLPDRTRRRQNLVGLSCAPPRPSLARIVRLRALGRRTGPPFPIRARVTLGWRQRLSTPLPATIHVDFVSSDTQRKCTPQLLQLLLTAARIDGKIL